MLPYFLGKLTSQITSTVNVEPRKHMRVFRDPPFSFSQKTPIFLGLSSVLRLEGESLV